MVASLGVSLVQLSALQGSGELVGELVSNQRIQFSLCEPLLLEADS
jgi:hypothetical protein